MSMPDAYPRSAMIRDAKIEHPRISSIERIDACRAAATEYSDVTTQRLSHLVGGLEAEIGIICREYGRLRTAYLQLLGDESDQSTDAQVDRIARAMAHQSLRHGTTHVTTLPPWALPPAMPESIRRAADASVRGMLGGDVDEGDESIPMDSTMLTDDDLIRIVGTIGRDAAGLEVA